MKLRMGFLASCVIAPLAGAGALTDFNLIVLGDVTSGSSEVEGRAVVFGDILASSTQNYAIASGAIADPPGTLGLAQTDSLIVGGQNFNLLNVNHGGVRIGGADTGATINLNDNTSVGTTLTYNDAGVAGVLGAVQADVQDTTSYFDALTADSTVNLSDFNNAVFNSMPGADHVAVFDIDASFFSRNGTFDLQGDLTADLFVIRVTGASTLNASSALNVFSNEFGQDSFQERIVWYFDGVTALTLTNGLGGAVFAPEADLVFGSPLEGTVVTNNLILDAEVHLPTSLVPEPTSTVLVTGGALLLWRRRRCGTSV